MIIVAPWLTSVLSIVISIEAITLWPFIIARAPMSAATERHERIHLAQQRELLVLGFYALYVWDYFRSRLRGHSPREAYELIRFEKEAHLFAEMPDYLQHRVPYAWRFV